MQFLKLIPVCLKCSAAYWYTLVVVCVLFAQQCSSLSSKMLDITTFFCITRVKVLFHMLGFMYELLCGIHRDDL